MIGTPFLLSYQDRRIFSEPGCNPTVIPAKAGIQAGRIPRASIGLLRGVAPTLTLPRTGEGISFPLW